MKKRKILVLCTGNSARSQMAEGLLNNMQIKGIKAYSAGSHPSGEVNVLAKEVMKELGINISYYISKGISSLPVKEFDYIIGMGCKDKCPFVPAQASLDWQISDPKGKDIDFFRNTRDEIKSRIEDFIKEINEDHE